MTRVRELYPNCDDHCVLFRPDAKMVRLQQPSLRYNLSLSLSLIDENYDDECCYHPTCIHVVISSVGERAKRNKYTRNLLEYVLQVQCARSFGQIETAVGNQWSSYTEVYIDRCKYYHSSCRGYTIIKWMTTTMTMTIKTKGRLLRHILFINKSAPEPPTQFHLWKAIHR